MTLHVKDAGTWKEVTALSVKDAGTWKAVQAGYVKDAGTWKQFYGGTGGGGGGGGGSLTVSLASSTLSASRQGTQTSGTVFTGTSQVPAITVTGSTGTLSYSWSRYSAPSDSGAMSCSGSTTQTPTWTGRAYDNIGPSEEVWRLTVTDSTGATGYADLTISLLWICTL